jgi:hypothetical protein
MTTKNYHRPSQLSAETERNEQADCEYSDGVMQPKTFPVVQMKFGWNES